MECIMGNTNVYTGNEPKERNSRWQTAVTAMVSELYSGHTRKGEVIKDLF